ncbi:TPA_exp: Nonribosomal peptide synthase SidE [Trichophyton benhamiae CBS 112371]|uniref:Nonribosomal peptide synthase SidE n=1 Tax=Arthroderma benhamiae (strain ATCC MYA-4681 / CBS 112371) TaxID=663331 RepID=D4AMX6_ARTBC|nr:nonribosomal peptide synthase SidE [Trichophyton benhamiae CBS 112371]EFE35537.1 nonribosomal peptide synthase SidE [Trichophyton benhamiae CBS 112371]DAA78383.1 TPA_exp: Nonribosomal peptide synthase SidE [Trichophyton benhamiae CBS 112371]
MLPLSVLQFQDDLPSHQELHSFVNHDLLIAAGAKFTSASADPLESRFENQIRLLWSRVLGVPPDSIGEHDDFFQCGGSASSAILLSQMIYEHGLLVTVRDIFQWPRLIDLVARACSLVNSSNRDFVPPFTLLKSSLDAQKARTQASHLCHVKESQVLDVLPCTPLQEGMLALTRSNFKEYVQQSIYRIDRDIDIGRLKCAWDQVVASNPILRTRIVSLPNYGIVQVVLDEEVQWVFESTLDQFRKRATPKELPMGLGDPLIRFGIISGMPGDTNYFTWEMHHALYDGWSIPLILSDVEHAYYQEPGPELLDMSPYIKYIQNIDEIAAHRFWTDQFAGIQGTGFPWIGLPAYVDLNPDILTTIMTRYVSGLDWGRSDFTAATIVRAAWALVLAIRADSNEALFGVTVTGRQAAVVGIEHMAGPAIATVPIRVKVDWKGNVHQLLQAVHRQMADMIPFEQTGLQNIRHSSEDAAIACQFRSLLVIHNNTPDDTQFSGRPFIKELPHSSVGPRPCDGRYAIDIDCRLAHDGVYARMEFDTRIFPKSEMTCVVEDFEKILRFLADNVNGQGRLADIVASMSSFTSRRLADVLRWNSHVPDPVPECVHMMVEKKALECPNSLAIHAWDGSLEYQHLLEISTKFALQLMQMGVTGTIVPLLFEKSLWMPVAALAVVKAGGVLVAMDMKQPYERLAQIVSQTNSPVLVCSEQSSSLAQRLGRQQFIIGWNCHHLDDRCQSKGSELPVIHPESLLYIVFTSGSTGTPKGVRITHQNLCTAIAHQREALGYNDKSRVIDFASYAFDVSWSNIFFSFAAGACLCIPSSQERENHLADSLRKYGINLMDSTPSLARALGKHVLSSLTTLIIGGEMILPSDALLAGGHTQIINAYSPAECTPTALISPLDATGVRIGRGFGVVTWIVEEDNPQQLASVGTVGELWLEGPLVGAGYLNDTEKTAAAFIQDPTWLVQNTGRRGRVYRTGDLVRYEPDGNIVFVCRKDDQVKIRGQRVELGEIESVIRRAIQQHTLQIVVEAVQQASDTGNLTLVAFLALQGSQEMDEHSHNTEVQRITEELASRLTQLLPSYMVPTMYFPLREIPMVTNDKTDRRRLRAMGRTLLSQAKSSAAENKETGNDSEEPLNETQAILQNTWMSVLNLSREEASIDATFARLGGDSISAMQIVSQCRMHNIHLTVSDILLSRTIRNLANVCRDVLSQENPLSPKLEEDSTALFDLSPIQRNFFDTYPDGLNHYNQFFLLDLKNPVSRASLEAAIQAIVLRHDMLRARFEKDLNTHTWKQRIAEYSKETFALTEHTMKDHAAVGLESQRRQENLDIRNGPMFACDLFNLPTGNQMLLLSAHHLVIDLVSWRIIWADLEDHLQSRNLHSAQTVSFQAWCAHQARIGRTLSPLLVLPYSIPEPQIGFWGVSSDENTYGQCKAVEVSFSSDVSSLLFGKSNDSLGTEGIDLILSALFHAFIHTFPERSTPAIWIEGHGREQFSEQPVDVSSTVGWFTSMYPFAIPINLHHSLSRDVVRLVKDTRRKVPANGQQFWACRYNSESGRLAFEAYDTPEIVLNFTGRFQQLEKEDGLFNPSSPSESSDSLLAITEVSKSARRQSMIDIEAAVSDGELKVEFIFHKMMQSDRLQKWIQNFSQDLEFLSHNFAQAPSGFTLSDFPLLPLSYKGLDILLEQEVPRMGVKPEQIQAIYPCSPLQEGMLISTAKGVASYHTRTICRCDSFGEPVCPLRLEAAWKVVASRHMVLSSLFTLHPEGNGFIQMVLDKPPVRVIQMETDDNNPIAVLNQKEPPSFFLNEPQHSLTICRSKAANAVSFRLDMNHTMNDAQSMAVLLEELAATYDGFELSAAPRFSDMISYIGQTPKEKTAAKWATILDGIKPCNFPTLLPSSRGMIPETLGEVSSSTPHSKTHIMDYCKKTNILFSAFLQVAWAITLSHYTGMKEVCFSYLTSGRDAPIERVEKMVGPLANLLISRVDMEVPVKEVLRATSKKSEQNMAIQHVFIGEVLHRLGLSGQRLFNTSLSIRSYDKEEVQKYSIKFQTLDDEDGHEYDLSLNVSLNRHGHTDLLLEYRKPYITQHIAEEVYEALNQAIDYLLTIDIDSNTGGDDLREGITIINNDQSAKSTSLFDQIFLQKYGVERSIADSFWKDQFSNTCGVHFPEVKQMVTTGIERCEKIHLTLKSIDFSPGSFPAEVVVGAAWAILTAHFSNSDESLFGVCHLNGEGSQKMLPTRTVLNWNNTILQFLSEIEQQIRSMEPFQRMRLEQISCLSDEAEFACNFQTLLVIGSSRTEGIERYENPIITNGDTKGSVFKGDNHAIVIKVSEGESHDVEIAMGFDSGIVSMDRAIRLTHELEHTIRQLLGTNRQEDKLCSVSVASHRDLNNIWAWNAELPVPVEGVIPDLIIKTVIQQPHFPAVNAWDGDLTYGELHELSSKLAHHLLAEGVGRGSIVPLCFEKSKWMPVAALAVMKTGAAAAAINISFPEQRLRSIIGQVFTSSKTTVILSSVSNQPFFESLGQGVVYKVGDDLHLPIGSTIATPEWPVVHPSDAFYIVFTSGTTGDAKGVVITHQNFISAIAYQGEFLGFGGNPRILDFTSYAFDVFWLNLLRALATGGSLCIPSQEEFENDLGGCLEKYQATVADLTPSVARIVEPRSAFSRLSTLVLGGEAILPSDLGLAGDETQLVLAYGPAECTPTSTILYGPNCLEGGEIGRGVGVCTWVVDLKNPDALAAVGAVGELWIEGPLVGEGYLNDPKRTAEAFVEDPIWLQRGSPDGRHPGRRGRLYRTGDLVQYQEDGSLLFLSRRDTQVKIRGQRVELGDLEHHIGSLAVKFMQDSGALGENGNVQVVAELVELSGISDKTLAAFIAVDGSSNSSSEKNEEVNGQSYNRLVQQMISSVRKQIEEVLPRYMLPSTYIPVKRIPIAATGKADRRELRRMAASLSTREIEALSEGPANERAPPQTEQEFVMQGLWAEVLKIEDRDCISASDSFFRLGGDSIAAMKIVALGRQRGLEFTVRDVFQHPVLRELCLQCHDLSV